MNAARKYQMICSSGSSPRIDYAFPTLGAWTPLIPNLTVLGAMLLVSAFLVVAAIIAQFSPRTRGRHYEEISP
jgi:hypothetical protein